MFFSIYTPILETKNLILASPFFYWIEIIIGRAFMLLYRRYFESCRAFLDYLKIICIIFVLIPFSKTLELRLRDNNLL